MSFRRFTLLVLFVSFVLSTALFSTAEYLIRTRVNEHDPVTQNLRLFLAGGKQNVVFGDSHVGNGANGLSEYGVFWQPGMSFENYERWVAGYLERNDVERIIVQLAPHMFRPEILADSDYDAYLEGREPFLYALELRFSSNLHRYFLEALSLITVDYQPFGIYQPNGSYPREGRWYDLTDEVRSERMAVRIGEMNPRAVLIQERAPSLKRMMSTLRQSGAEVCVAVFPLALEYAEEMEKNPAYMEALQLFENLSDQSGARYVNLSKTVTNPDHIFNQDHLNTEGGEAFGPVLESACFG